MIVFLILGLIFNLYFIALNLLSPATLGGTFFGFSSVWFWLSVVCFLWFSLRKLHLWANCPFAVKASVLSFFFLDVVFALISLFFIVQPAVSDGTENPEYVILLGGGITKERTLARNLQERVRFAAEYLEKHPTAVCVVTGGKGKFIPCPETDVLVPALMECGIPGERILVEQNAKDTIQNFQLSAKLLAEYSGRSVEEVISSPITVITSDFHLARGERLARRMGFTQVYGAASKTPWIFVPNVYCREICCYLKLNLRILFTGKPEKL